MSVQQDVIELVNDLIELFLASRTLQQQLYETEVSAISTNEGISVLPEIAAEQDKALEEALAKVANNTRGSKNVEFSGSNNTGF